MWYKLTSTQQDELIKYWSNKDTALGKIKILTPNILSEERPEPCFCTMDFKYQIQIDSLIIEWKSNLRKQKLKKILK